MLNFWEEKNPKLGHLTRSKGRNATKRLAKV